MVPTPSPSLSPQFLHWSTTTAITIFSAPHIFLFCHHFPASFLSKLLLLCATSSVSMVAPPSSMFPIHLDAIVITVAPVPLMFPSFIFRYAIYLSLISLPPPFPPFMFCADSITIVPTPPLSPLLLHHVSVDISILPPPPLFPSFKMRIVQPPLPPPHSPRQWCFHHFYSEIILSYP